MYYNTTKQKGEQLELFQKKAKTQAECILEFMRFSKYPWSPSQVHRQVFSESVPLTSVRRAMTDLAKDGHLVKTNKTVDGPYGRPEFCWVAS